MDNRQKYFEAVKSQLETNMLFHSLALEACICGIYDYLKSQGQISAKEPSREDWLLAGLLHDIDYSEEFKDFHPTKTKEVLVEYNLEISDEINQVIRAHSPKLSGVQPMSKAQWAIFCADSLTGLITATTFVLPSKKIGDVKLSSVVKRFLKEPRFAAGTRRGEVVTCSNPDGLNIPLEKFIEICLVSMQGIAGQINL